MTPAAVLEITGLHTRFIVGRRTLTAVQDVDLSVERGETVALVGESGSGKSVTALSVMGLLPTKIGRSEGKVLFSGKSGQVVDLLALEREALRLMRGNDLGMIFQEPMTSLNPVYTVGEQIAEPIRIHLRHAPAQAAKMAVELLNGVGIPDPGVRAKQYPHELSGGMRQRATIAMALACNPTLLIADEPTTALDVTVQAQILDLLRVLQQERGMGILFVTHNLGVVAEIAHRVAVMYAGRIVETGTVKEVFSRPLHPYTIGLLRSIPRLGEASRLRKDNIALPTIEGTVPSLFALPKGCVFAPRCRHALESCRMQVPPLAEIGEKRASRCLRWQEI